jgi:hypothetical protein
MRPLHAQRGLAAAAVLIVIILAAVVLVLGRGIFDKTVLLDQRAVTDANLKRVADALVSYTALNRFLPCPAQGNDSLLAGTPENIGKADPEGATNLCNAQDGVVPWQTIALRRSEALDGWGRKISYRVFSGGAGFTTTNGLNMTACNTSLAPDAPMDSLGSASSCKTGSPPPNTPSQFLAARGTMLEVEEEGGIRSGNAFVLISHGESGNGAFIAEVSVGGAARVLAPASTKEIANTQAGTRYWNTSRSPPGVQPAESTYFDDVVAYMSAPELVAKAKLLGRPYSQFPLTATMSTSSIEAAVPGFDHTRSQDTGRTSLALGGFLITASSSLTPGPLNIGFREQDSVGGIGVIGGGSTSGDLNSFFDERLTFQLGSGSEFQQADVALNAFEVVDFFPRITERAEISFWRGGVQQQASILVAWHIDNRPSRCLFELVPGMAFDRLDVRALSRSGDSGSSRFTVSSVKACNQAESSCTTSVSNARDCPARPPSTAAVAATSVSQVGAILNGVLSANGFDTTARFEYGTTTNYGSIAAVSGTFSGTEASPVSASLTGLTCNTTYHYRVRAVSSGGTTTSNDIVMTTPRC